MTRFLTIALLASAALPVAARAQDDNGRPHHRMEQADGTPAARPDRGPRPDRPQPQFDRGPRPERAARPEQPNVAPPAAQAAPDRERWQGRRDGGGWRGNRNWQGAGAPAPTPNAVAPPEQQQQQRRDWNRGGDARRNWNGGANDPGRDWNRSGDDRRWDGNRSNDGRRDWDRNNDGRRDWDRNNDGRRDWDGNRGDWNNGRRWDNDRRDGRNWSRDWRNDRRYDWQRYRTSNRNAYRLPRYYAPNGWQYGYRRFDIGAYLFAGLFAQNYWISDPYEYRLPPAYWPYQWVRYYDDALLVDTRTGYVVDMIPGIFW